MSALRRALRPSSTTVCLAAIALLATDWGSRTLGGSVVPGGPVDEAAHLLTTLLVVWTLGRWASERFAVGALLASVAIDADHVPGRLGADWLTAGTPRPYTHSLTTVAVCLVAALALRRERSVLLGVAVGLVTHLWRDLGESGAGVALLWPVSPRSFTVAHASYLAATIAIAGLAAYRARRVGAARSRLPIRRGIAVPVFLGAFAIAWLVHDASSRTGSARGSDQQAAPVWHRCRPIWQDEFSGSAGSRPDPARWHIVSGVRGGQSQYYTERPENVSLDGDGHLAITARRETFTDDAGTSREFTSASIETKGLFATTFGRIEARIQLPAGQGLWPAFWALGSDYDSVGWPQSGEIDVMENLGQDPYTIHGSVHGPRDGVADGYAITMANHSAVPLAGGFHVYGVEWRSQTIVFEVDRVPYATVTPSSLAPGEAWVFEKPFFLLLSLAVGGWAGEPDASTQFPATVLVDWVRVYR
jgi:beta-glucanase (GH16 family)